MLGISGGLIATEAGVLGLAQSAWQTILRLAARIMHVGRAVIARQYRRGFAASVVWRGWAVRPGPAESAFAWLAATASLLLWLVWATRG